MIVGAEILVRIFYGITCCILLNFYNTLTVEQEYMLVWFVHENEFLDYTFGNYDLGHHCSNLKPTTILELQHQCWLGINDCTASYFYNVQMKNRLRGIILFIATLFGWFFQSLCFTISGAIEPFPVLIGYLLMISVVAMFLHWDLFIVYLIEELYIEVVDNEEF